jgi:hypothetical protein
MRKGPNGKRVIKLEKSPKLENGEALCMLTTSGIVDP